LKTYFFGIGGEIVQETNTDKMIEENIYTSLNWKFEC